MKKAILISYYDWYDKRLIYLEEELKQRGYIVQYYTSNINHLTKEKIKDSNKQKILINVPMYKKNISIKRIYSLYVFSKKISKIIKREKPNFIYCIIPPNYLVERLRKLKVNMNFKLVFDIIDLWPESLPMKKFNNTIFFTKWRDLRKNIDSADIVITECDRYHEILKKQVNEKKLFTIRLIKKFKKNLELKPLDSNVLHLCYLGSINNLIDIDCINSLIKKLCNFTPVEVHIIGDGCNRDRLITTIQHSGAKVHYYGKIFDEEKKQQIFNKCHYGLNIYKENTLIGLTIKSIDYFKAGLPIINNIKGDTEEIINSYNIGLNINDIKGNILYCDLNYKKQVYEIARSIFDKNNAIKKYNKLLTNLLK